MGVWIEVEGKAYVPVIEIWTPFVYLLAANVHQW